ncbi:hypothetical protein GCM10010149_38700 [Nonomuraea roseoviolacea subsp. roseoviolacea]
MLRQLFGKRNKVDIERVIVLLIHRAQLQIRTDSGELKRGENLSQSESQLKFERIYWLSDLCHGIVGPFGFSSKKLRRERLYRCLEWAWGMSHSERRAWMVEYFDEIEFDYSVLKNDDLGRS